jgi:aminoglycoside phosphotransferase family enzyme
MSWVFLIERFVYKLKKPVRLGLLDFSTPERRRHNCCEELRLNRRLAADVYLDVVSLSQSTSGRLALGGEGERVDWLVRMRRLSRQCMLDQAIARGDVEPGRIGAIARMLARFYQAAEPVALTAGEYIGRFGQYIADNDAALAEPRYGLPRRQTAGLRDALMHCLERHATEFADRARAGRVIEAHGDLRPEHVCLTDPPLIIDCLEFSRQLRELDPADELGFLDMECEHAGAPSIGPLLFKTYREETGDDPPPAVVGFYKAYRAQMRAKLAIWHLDDCGDGDRTKWIGRSEAYLALAARFAARAGA